MQAVILAGGKGTRLKPYTTIFPKPLMPIGDMPILEIVIRQLKYYGVKDIILAVGYLSELIKAYFGNGDKLGVTIEYSYEDKPLGTAAPLSLIKNLEQDFLVMNGDILCDINFNEFIEFHKKSENLCTISAFKKAVKIDLGVLETNEKGYVINYLEKPVLHYNVSMGIYAFKKETISSIPQNKYFDFPDLIKTLILNKKNVMTYSFEGYWLDIGRKDDYEIALDEFQNHMQKFLK